MNNRKRPQYIEKQLNEINDIFRSIKLKDEDRYNNDLFTWFTNYLLHNNWYRGYNMYVDMTDTNGEFLGRGLAGPDYKNKDYYIQIW